MRLVRDGTSAKCEGQAFQHARYTQLVFFLVDSSCKLRHYCSGTTQAAMSDDIFPEQQQTSTGIAQARRRVNPDSLAVRLGPDLVRDMEALIVPGNIEMPSFAVRKELQERYNVDRRHIYDYFHSRGLRVVKEEKVSKGTETPMLCRVGRVSCSSF